MKSWIAVDNWTEVHRLSLPGKTQSSADEKLLDRLTVGVFRLDAAGKCIYVNEFLARLSGLSREENLGEGWGKLIHPDDIPKLTHGLDVLLREGTDFITEHRLKLPDGSTKWIRAHLVLYVESDGARGVLGTVQDLTEREAMQAELLESRAFLSSVIERLPVAVFAKSAGTFQFTLWNKKSEQVFGIEAHEILGKNDYDFFPKEQADHFREMDQQTLAAKEVVEIPEEPIDSVTLGRRILRTHKVPILDAKGNAVLLLGIAEDITERRQAEERLRKSESSLSEAQQIARLGSWEWNLETGQIAWSDQMFRLFEVQPGTLEMKATSVIKFFLPDDMAEVQRQAKKVIKAGTAFDFEHRIRCVSGNIKYIHARGRAVTGANGRTVRLIGTAHDVTENREIEKRLQLSEALRTAENEKRSFEQHLKAIVSNLPVVLWATDEVGHLMLLEGKALDLMGLKPGQRLGLDMLAKGATTAEVQRCIRRALQGESVTGAWERDGREFEIYYSPLFGEGNKVTGIVAVTTDVTLRREAQKLTVAAESAREASRLKSEFLANMSHEIRTPINGIVGMLGVLMDTQLSVEQADYAQTIHRSADVLLSLVNDVLDFSKVEAGKLELESVEFELRKMLSEVENAHAHAASAKGLRFEVSCAVGVDRIVKGDASRIQQVLSNLISNSIKFTLSGEVRCDARMSRDGRAVRFEVRDTGIGIPKETLGKMFQPFSQADASTSRRFGGTGLGLSICRKLVELMHGRVGVESKAGQGSLFWVEIPLEFVDSKRSSDRTAAKVALPVAKFEARILIAEDNPVNQKVALHMLQKLGYRAHAVGNGNEALDAMREIPFDLILMDCQMPELDGYAATQTLRKSRDPFWQRIPIIALTANAIEGEKEKCLAAGMNDFLPKPVRIEALAATIEKWLASSKATTPELKKAG